MQLEGHLKKVFEEQVGDIIIQNDNLMKKIEDLENSNENLKSKLQENSDLNKNLINENNELRKKLSKYENVSSQKS